MRIRYAHNINISIHKFKIGYEEEYYDGWNNCIYLGFILIYWMTPPLKSDQGAI